MKNYADVRTQVESISPAIAAKLLQNNIEKNRNVRERRVEDYKHQMELGRWAVNGEAIIVSNKGRLLDGQHRLAAVVAYGKPVDMLICRGVQEDTMSTLDLGAARTHADHLKMKGFEGNLTSLSAAIAIVLKFKNGVLKDLKSRLAPIDTITFLERNKGIMRSHERISSDKELGRLIPASILTAAHYLFYQIDPTKTESFFTLLSTGEDLKKGNPILSLRNQLLLMRGDKRTSGYTKRVFISYLIKAFSAWLNDERVDGYYKAPVGDIELPKKRRK